VGQFYNKCTWCRRTTEHVRSRPLSSLHTLAEINIGFILGLNAAGVNNPQDQIERNPRSIATQKGMTRLLQILISESAHLIWVLRCERIIREENHSDDEIRARWLRKINFACWVTLFYYSMVGSVALGGIPLISC
jgi:hypothetical protein